MTIKFLTTLEKPKPIKADAIEDKSLRIDFYNWLPFAAPEFNLSINPEDYVLYTVPLHTSDLPNRNGYAMPLTELLKWNTEHGCQAYMTWKGKPMFVEHKSDVQRDAIGLVADVALRPIKGYGGDKFWKVMALVALDTTKNTDLVNKIKTGQMNTYSMGAMVDDWHCSYCGAGSGKCNHIDPNRPVTLYEFNRQLVYKNISGLTGYEFSVVADPACVVAISDTQISFDLRKNAK